MQVCWYCEEAPATTTRLEKACCEECKKARFTCSSPKYRFGEVDDAMGLKLMISTFKLAFQGRGAAEQIFYSHLITMAPKKSMKTEEYQ